MVKGAPGYKFFDQLFKEIPDVNIVVEGLGDLRPEVHNLRDITILQELRSFNLPSTLKKLTMILKIGKI